MPRDEEAWNNCDVEAVSSSMKAGHLTPRSLKAIEKAGCVPEDLIPITKKEFKVR